MYDGQGGKTAGLPRRKQSLDVSQFITKIMVVFLNKALNPGKIYSLKILNVYSRFIFGVGHNKNKIPPPFVSKIIIDDVGKQAVINENDLRWFHYEDYGDEMIIFDHFRLPHYVRPGDTIILDQLTIEHDEV